jgi:hypothetical protein
MLFSKKKITQEREESTKLRNLTNQKLANHT